jgi:prophage antirepressor-like protein
MTVCRLDLVARHEKAVLAFNGKGNAMGNEKALQIFRYQDNEVRHFLKDGQSWWVASDVCKILEHSDVSMAVRRLDDDEKGTNSVCTPGGNQSLLCINEPGLYTLILTSRKAEAKAFKRWVTHEVIPSIRKTGTYSLGQSTPQEPAPTLSDALRQRAFLNEKRVPVTLFSTQCELARELHYVEGFLNASLDNKASLETSVGKCFSPYAREVIPLPDTERCKYRHQLPSGRIVDAWAYPIGYLPHFRHWLYTVYFPIKFPAYQHSRAKRIGVAQTLQGSAPRKRIATKGVEQLQLF